MQNRTQRKTLNFSPVEEITVMLFFHDNKLFDVQNVSLISLFQTGSIAVYFENTRETTRSSRSQVSDYFSSGNAFGE